MLKKTSKRLMAAVLAVVMMLSMSTVAFAATGSMKVYVDNDYTGVSDAYQDRHDDVYVDSWDDIRDIFPDETEDMLSASPNDDVCLNDWADEFGYDITVKNNKVYLYSDRYHDNPVIDDDDYPWYDDSEDEEPYIRTVKVYRNGFYVSNAAYTYGSNTGSVYVNYPQTDSLKAIFGSTPTNASTSYQTLQQWATALGYKYYRYDDSVFINNDGKTPIIVMLNGERVDFPDQQPIVVDPGYTMIPVYALGEMLGYDVKWVGGQAQQVNISNRNHTINLYIGYPYMRYDGKWLQMAVAPIVTGDRTLVPARFVVEAFGLNIWYDNSMLTAGGPGVVHIYK